MILCFTSHVDFYIKEGKYICTPGFCKMMEVIAPLFNEVKLCVPVYDEDPAENLGVVDVPNIRICPLPPYYNKGREIAALIHPFKLMRCLWPYIKQSDLVWINIPNSLGILAWLVCLLQRKRFVLTIVGNYPELIRLGFRRRGIPVLGSLLGGAFELANHLMISASTTTLVNSTVLLEIYGRGKPYVDFFVDSSITESDISKTVASSNSDECRILYVGRLESAKGFSELLQAARDLLTEGLKFRILLAGDGYRRDDIRKEAEELGIIEQVKFLGWIAIEKLKDIYRACDIFVFPSYSEGMPKAVIEAMANGLPVVVTNVGGIPSVVEDGRTAFLIQPRDAGAIRDALRKLILDKPLRRRMAEAGLERSRQFTMDAERACFKSALQKFGLLSQTIEGQETKQ
jgi:glycosyltransferase involved in cell wall biosynthesis